MLKHDQFLLLQNPRWERKSCELCDNSFFKSYVWKKIRSSILCKACAEMKVIYFQHHTPLLFLFCDRIFDLTVNSSHKIPHVYKELWTGSKFSHFFFFLAVSVVRSLRFRAWTIRQIWRWESLHHNDLKSQWKGFHNRITLKCRNFKILTWVPLIWQGATIQGFTRDCWFS